MLAHNDSKPLPRVLLIDDDAISLEVLGMLLEMHGFVVDSAESGRQALGMLEERSDNEVFALPGLILMDTQMPGLSGLELVKWMRKFSTAPIVAISGSVPDDAILKATNGFLLKPVSAEDVVAFLNTGVKAQTTPSFTGERASETVPTIDSAALDPVVLGKLKAMMPASAVREIYSAVAADLKTRLDAMKTAMDANNTAEVQRIAHTIKGGCGMVGLIGAVEASARLEISNLPVTWKGELLQLHLALGALEGMLGDEFPT
jgi:CheY-like chemotaxis protein